LTCVLGREQPAVLEALNKGVDMVHLVSLRAGQIKDDDGLLLVGQGDVDHLATGEDGGVMPSYEIVGKKRLSGVASVAVVPEELSAWRVDRPARDGDQSQQI